MISHVAVIPEGPHWLHCRPGLVGERIVDQNPSSPLEISRGFEFLDSFTVDALVFPYGPGEEVIERTGIFAVDKDTVNAFHREVLRDHEPQHIPLQMIEGKGPKMLPIGGNGLSRFLGKVRTQRHRGSPRRSGHARAAYLALFKHLSRVEPNFDAYPP